MGLEPSVDGKPDEGFPFVFFGREPPPVRDVGGRLPLMRVSDHLSDIAETVIREVVALAQSGKLKPTPVETRPAAEVNRTLQELHAGRVLGRVVLDLENA